MDIVGKAASAGEQTKILFAPHRLTNAVRDVARQIHTRHSVVSDWRPHRLPRALVGATNIGEDAGCLRLYYERCVFRGRLIDGPKGWNRQPAAARRAGSQVARRPNDPPRRGYRRSDCPSLRSRRIAVSFRPPLLVPILRSWDGQGLAFLRDH